MTADPAGASDPAGAARSAEPADPTGSADPAPPRRRLRHRLPLSLRKHWTLLTVSVVALLVVVVALGGTRIRPYITGNVDVITSSITQNVEGTVLLFDDEVAHQIHLEIDDIEYAEMIDAFERNGDKDWVTADMTIDGVFLNDVAVRLKGNSTLMGLRGEGPGGEGPGAEGGGRQPGPPGMGQGEGMPELPEGFEPPEMPAGMPELPEGFEPPEMPAGMPTMPGMDAGISADDPASLPLLISIDKNYPGRAYQGMTELSVRPGTPVLNEAVALDLTAATGLASQRYSYSEYSINDDDSTTRLVLEHPDDGYASTAFDGSGYLYKADANSRFEYVGDDQSDYSDQFTPINSQGDGTLQPIIDLLRWVDSADDEEFAAELDQWIDVDSLATYLATQNLLSNFDDMAGPGQNYYLWYDLESTKFTVVSWDLNMAMSGDTAAGPDDTVSMGGPGGGGRMAGGPMGAVPDGAAAEGDVPAEGAAPMGGAAPEGELAAGLGAGQMPGGFDQDGEQRPGGMAAGHPLKTRFLESDAFTALYEEKYWELYDTVYGSGLAAQTLENVRGSFPVSDAVDQATLDEEADSLRSWIEQRTAALAEQRPV
ncbi:MAG: CotH kinase family protein [Dietzia psychralcaliphila]